MESLVRDLGKQQQNARKQGKIRHEQRKVKVKFFNFFFLASIDFVV